MLSLISLYFAAMVIAGSTTQMDLSRMRTYLFMGLIGLLIAGLVNLFLISIARVLIFTGLTAYDDGQGNIAIVGALILYLDFINLFIYMLRLLATGIAVLMWML